MYIKHKSMISEVRKFWESELAAKLESIFGKERNVASVGKVRRYY